MRKIRSVLYSVLLISTLMIPGAKACAAEVPGTENLQSLFLAHNMKVGTCISPSMLDTPAAEKIILSDFNSLTMENLMKPENILQKKHCLDAGTLVVDFPADAIRILDWAKEHDYSMRGHTLIWHSQTPDWIFYEDFDTDKALVSRDVMLSRMENYIKSVFSFLEEHEYTDMFYAYDVVNEALMDDGSLRESLWLKTIGEDYILYAFSYADQYAPETIDLYYNDYNEQYKNYALVQLAKTLVNENGDFLIDGIGLQGHLYTKDDQSKYFRMLETLSSSGLKLEITELDISLGSWQYAFPTTEKNLNDQAAYYRRFLQNLFERVDQEKIHMDALTFWGFSDGLSWRRNAAPLLYDADFIPKPAYEAVLSLY